MGAVADPAQDLGSAKWFLVIATWADIVISLVVFVLLYLALALVDLVLMLRFARKETGARAGRGDGADAPAGRDEAGRRAAINTIGPLWDGNEVWLIVAGAAMFAAFPGWYAAMFSALYLALVLLLVALIVRGISFEFAASAARRAGGAPGTGCSPAPAWSRCACCTG